MLGHPKQIWSESVSDPLDIDCVVELAVQSKSDSPEVELRRIVDELSSESVSFVAHLDDDSQTVIIRGRNELQLEQSAALFDAKLGNGLLFGEPRVIYRETISKPAEVDQTQDGRWSPAIRLLMEPMESGSGRKVEIGTNFDTVPSGCAAEITNAIYELLDRGVLAGFPMTDLRVTLLGVAHQEVDSGGNAVRKVVRLAFLEAAKKAAPFLLEPVGLVEVTTPENWMGDVLGDLNERWGGIRGTRSYNDKMIIEAHVPIAQMFGYANALANMSEGKATYTLTPSHFQRLQRQTDDPPPSEPASKAMSA